VTDFAGWLVVCPNCGRLVLLIDRGRELYLERIADAEAATGRKMYGLMVGTDNEQPATITDEHGVFRCPMCQTMHTHVPLDPPAELN
jgi:Zn finger protein HypA/HybF involved in hydrogenase expression